MVGTTYPLPHHHINPGVSVQETTEQVNLNLDSQNSHHSSPLCRPSKNPLRGGNPPKTEDEQFQHTSNSGDYPLQALSADVLQQPDKQHQQALVLDGGNGTGKSGGVRGERYLATTTTTSSVHNKEEKSKKRTGTDENISKKKGFRLRYREAKYVYEAGTKPVYCAPRKGFRTKDAFKKALVKAYVEASVDRFLFERTGSGFEGIRGDFQGTPKKAIVMDLIDRKTAAILRDHPVVAIKLHQTPAEWDFGMWKGQGPHNPD